MSGKASTTGIFYDLARVSERLRQRAPDGGREFVLNGTPWPSDAPSPRGLQTERDVEYLDRLMQWIERFRIHLERCGLTPQSFSRQGSGLFELVRYELMLKLAKPVRRWEIAAELGKAGPFVWRDDDLPLPGRRQDAALTACARQVRFERSPNSDPRVWYARARDRAFSFVSPQLERGRWLASRIPEVQRGQVVFTEFFPNSAKALLPVARILREEYQQDVVWLAARPEVGRVLAKKGVPYVALEALVPPRAVIESVLTRAERQRIRQAVAVLNDLPVQTPNPGPLRAQIARIFTQACAEGVRWLAAYAPALELLAPKALVTTTYSSVVGRAAALAARQVGAPSVYVQHGAFSEHPVYAYFLNDALCMWGDYERDALVGHGLSPERIHVTGATIYDEFIRRARAPRSHEGVSIGFLASKTAGAVSSLEVSRRTLEAVGALSRSIPGAQVTMKPHPSDRTSLPEELVARYPEVKLIREGSSQEVVLESDVVIVVSSTTGFEACVAGRPLIVFNLTGGNIPVEYVRLGAALEVTDAAELPRAIDRVLHDETCRAELAAGRRRLIDRMLAGARLDAAERVARVVAGASIVAGAQAGGEQP